MTSLLLLNGSPRGKRGNTAILMQRFAEGWMRAGGDSPETLHLAHRPDFDRAVEAFGTTETVVFGMPLYTDAMPGLVKEFIEALEVYVGRENNPRLGFLIQSGFAEAHHSRHLQRYLEKLAKRLDSEYAGTIVKGGGEAIKEMPDRMNAKTFERTRRLAGSLYGTGRFDPALLEKIAGTERFSWLGARLTGLVSATPLGRFYWNGQLKRNGAWERRFARPYENAAIIAARGLLT